MALWQGGGGALLTSGTPGDGLPDLDTARAVAFAEPVAPTFSGSTQACSTCAPCTGTCDPAANHAPAAFTSGPYVGRVNAPVVFNSGGSFDPDGDALSYLWNFGDNTTGTGQAPTHTYASAGTYAVTLTVTDTQNQTGTATTTAAVAAPPAPTPTPTPGTGANAAEFVSQSVPSPMDGGRSYNVSVTMRNTGASAWTAAHLYRLGVENPRDNTIWGITRVHVPHDVAPGATVTFNFTVVAPRPESEHASAYNFQWQMVQDGVEWFGLPTQNLVVWVNPALTAANPADLSMARLAPANRVGTGGDDLLSRNFNWGVPLVNLAGRAGLNLNLSLSYNSLVWTKLAAQEGDDAPLPSITFDADQGFPAPGFRLGLPALQGPFLNNLANKFGYLFLLPSGQRVELRQSIDGSYRSVDSSNVKMLLGGNGQALVRAPDGTGFTYVTVNGAYRCTGVKDRNGNFIAAAYNTIGRLTTLTDTLGRVVNYNYDANNRLQSISQTRGSGQRVWATFGYAVLPIQTNFQEADGSPIAVQGPQNGASVTVLTDVGLADGSRYTFDYTPWGQIATVVRRAADAHILASTAYDLPTTSGTAHSDCPRFTERRDWAENWNDNQQAVTKYFAGTDANGAWVGASRADAPDVVMRKEYYSADGLLLRGADYAAGNPTPQKVLIVDWTHDEPGAGYLTNPRPTQTTITDAAGNVRLTAFNYTTFGLLSDVYELGGSPLAAYRRTHIDYNLSAQYVSRHVIGLVAGQYTFGPEDNFQQLYGKATFTYDEAGAGGEYLQDQGNPAGHDASYGAAFREGRGNRTSAARWDANSETDAGKALTSHVAYNTTGAAVFTRDPLNHQTSISYQDAFTTSGAFPATLAYPTGVTDADGFTSAVKYDYYTGQVTRTQGPPPQGAAEGAIRRTSYDAAGRVRQVSTFLSGGAEQSNTPYHYTRRVYPTSQIIVNTFATVQEGAGEAYSATVFDGAGRVRAAASDFPGSAGRYRGQYTGHDLLGQVVRQYRPTEMNNVWGAAGDDAAGWYYSLQAYDWQGRPTTSTNSDGSMEREITYGGCGCAGGAVVTVRDAVGRRQKSFSDPLGRAVKAQVLNTNDTVYSAAVTTYNAVDQVTRVRAHKGDETEPYQEATNEYDGHGRLWKGKSPSQIVPTEYGYDGDDAVRWVRDARGVRNEITYNQRHLPTGVLYNVTGVASVTTSTGGSTPVEPAANVTYAYDAAGNRQTMAEAGTGGGVAYTYDALSRLTAEARTFPGIAHQTFTLAYEHTLAGALKQVTDRQAGTGFTTTYDRAGQVTGVSGVGHQGAATTFVSGTQYRAWGALKSASHGNGTVLNLGYDVKGLVSSYAVSGIKSRDFQPPPPFTIGSTYERYADGQVKFVNNVFTMQGAVFIHNSDRAYSYDHAGRLAEAYTGAEARDFANHTTGGAADGAYRHSYAYDEWGNMLAGGGRVWSRANVSTASYDAAGRNPAWEYDAAGHVISRHEPPPAGYDGFAQPARYTFDAAGRPAAVAQTRGYFDQNGQTHTTAYTNTTTYDGDGRAASYTHLRVSNGTPHPETARYLRSTALGGAVVSEYDGAGAWGESFVYAWGERVGRQGRRPGLGTPHATWRHADPVTGDEAVTEADGATGDGGLTLDPLGNHVGGSDPFPAAGAGGEDIPAPFDNGFTGSREVGQYLAFGGGAQCVLDGVAVDCQYINSNATAELPAGAGPRRVVYHGVRTWAFWRAFADGYEGYTPLNATASDGVLRPLDSSGRRPTYRQVGRQLKGTDFGRLNGVASGEETDLRRHDGFNLFPRARGAQPPNTRGLTTTEIGELRSALQDVLSNNKGCAEFMEAFLAELGNVAGVRPFDTNALNVFNRIASNPANLQSTDESGVMERAGGAAGAGTGRILFNLTNMAQLRGGDLYVPTILHGVAHAAQNQAVLPWYSHQQMDMAAFNVLVNAGRGIAHYEEDNGLVDFDPSHSYFAGFIDRNCVRRSN